MRADDAFDCSESFGIRISDDGNPIVDVTRPTRYKGAVNCIPASPLSSGRHFFVHAIEKTQSARVALGDRLFRRLLHRTDDSRSSPDIEVGLSVKWPSPGTVEVGTATYARKLV